MTSLTLELGGHEPFDLALDARRFVLWRQGSVVRLTLGPADLDRVRRSLALRGVRTVPAEGDVPIPASRRSPARPRRSPLSSS